MNKNTPIYSFLETHAKKKSISFHMPGHKGMSLYQRFGYDSFLQNFMNFDITEIHGADNLFQTEGILKEAQERYARLYDVKYSYLLINGTSGGIIAAILASVNKGKKLIMARNCHKSIFNALTLGDIQPVYAYPELIDNHSISGPITAQEIERLLIENPDAEAVILPSPNYYGICSPIDEIAKVVHDYNKVFIVDEAHGAHLKFFEVTKETNELNDGLEMPKSAVSLGADIVINSIHKTLGSLTQSAVLHLNSHRVDRYVLEDKLQCIESTSPSYLLMASLDISAAIIEEHGRQLILEWKDNLEAFYSEAKAISGLQIMRDLTGLDYTKININMSSLGISGSELERILMEEFNIFMELVTGDYVMGMSGIGNTKEDYINLLEALKIIAVKYGRKDLKTTMETTKIQLPKQASLSKIPREKKRVKLEDAVGLVCASLIIPYPPGIPLLCPGEMIREDAIHYIKALRESGEKVIGVNENGEIIVG